MEINQSICCRELRKADVMDTGGNKVGKIHDLAFKFDGELHLTKFILAGQRFEEILETLHIRKDNDPVFDASLIEKIGDKIKLNKSINSLKTTIDEGAIGKDEIRLSKLEKLEIIDKNGAKVGKAVDVDFDVDGSASLIVGGGVIEETLESIGVKKDIDIIVPGKVIDSITDKIQLGVAKDELKLTMVEMLKKKEQIKAQSDLAVHRDVSKVRLFSQRPF